MNDLEKTVSHLKLMLSRSNSDAFIAYAALDAIKLWFDSVWGVMTPEMRLALFSSPKWNLVVAKMNDAGFDLKSANHISDPDSK